MRDYEDIKEDIRHALDMQRVAEMCGLAMRKGGAGLWVARCPFHAEKSGSFNIGGKKGFEHRGHCFGCGWDGDIFAFWMELKGCDFKQAVEDLARCANVPTGADGIDWRGRPEVPRVRQAEAPAESGLDGEVDRLPSLPPLRHLRREECDEIAVRRGLDAEAVWLCAREFKRMAFSPWPLFERPDGVWLPRCLAHGRTGCHLERANCVAEEAYASWCAIDATRRCAEFRRITNEPYPLHDGRAIKTWSTCGKAWPLGAAHLNGRPAVLLVEGGPDMLAGYHFLRRHKMTDRVAVVCMLGAANRMRQDALPHFAGKRVRIMMDADALKDDPNPRKRRVPGLEAAARWKAQLLGAGAVVDTYCLGPIYEPEDLEQWGEGGLPSAEVRVRHPGLLQKDGTPVKDLNDLAKCGDEVLSSDDVREAFRCWDF